MNGIEGFAAKTGLSQDSLDRLSIYAAMLEKWTPRINLVAPSTLPTLWERHFLDSAQLWRMAPGTARSWMDLGSGGGFPGLVIAMIAKSDSPDLHVTLVESDQRKATFLRSVSRETETPVTVLAERIESITAERQDVVSARALAPLNDLLGYAETLLKPDGIALFPKGENHESEITASLANWTFSLHKEPSESSPNSAILSIGDLARV